MQWSNNPSKCKTWIKIEWSREFQQIRFQLVQQQQHDSSTLNSRRHLLRRQKWQIIVDTKRSQTRRRFLTPVTTMRLTAAAAAAGDSCSRKLERLEMLTDSKGCRKEENRRDWLTHLYVRSTHAHSSPEMDRERGVTVAWHYAIIVTS